MTCTHSHTCTTTLCNEYHLLLTVIVHCLLLFLSKGFVNDKVQTLFDTMTEISSILYARSEDHCQRSIFRLHNQAFIHAIACQEVIGMPQILSQKKFYGRYFHSLVVHAPIQLRIISLRSTNTEQQERHFSAFSSISVTTSSRRPGEIITPGIIRMQAEVKSEENKSRDAEKERESRLAKLACCLPPAKNTIIPHRVILKYPCEYQAHLERISDFLLCGEGVWWRHNLSGVEFLDGPQERQANNGPPLHHFRSHTLQSEEQHLRKCWKECLTQEIAIPHHAIRIYDEDGDLLSVRHTNFLESDDASDEEMSPEEAKICDHNRGTQAEEEEEEEEDGEIIVDVQQIGEALLDSVDDCDRQCPSEGNNNYYSFDPINESVSSKEPTVLPPAPVASTVETYQLKSTLANNVSQVLGETNEVMRFDKLRANLKNLGTTQAKEDYEVALAAIQTRVLAKHSTLKQQFKEWE